MESTKQKGSKLTTVRLKLFYVRTKKPQDFIEKLEQLCRKYSNQKDFFFNYSVED